MKIDTVETNRRRRAFVISTSDGEYSFPFAKLRLQPTDDDPVEDAFPDPELGNEAFTYCLASGAEDTIHLDAVREFARDPDYLQELFLHRLTVEAVKGLRESGMGKRELSRQLGTSPSQLYRLLDPDNQRKSIGQMLALLHLVDRDVELVVRERTPKPAAAKALKGKSTGRSPKRVAEGAQSQKHRKAGRSARKAARRK